MPEIDVAELAANYGFAQAVLNSDPELASIFNQAVQGTWTAERFQAAVQNSGWWKNNSSSVRDAAILKASDPATYAAKVAQIRTRLVMMMHEMGAAISDVQADAYAEQAYQFSWDDNQMRQTLGTYIQHTDGRFIGQAAQVEQELRAWANDMGVKMSDQTLTDYVSNVIKGGATIDTAKGAITTSAASAYPHLRDRLLAGETVRQIADPYMQTAASLLELSPEAVSLDEPLVKRALATKDSQGAVGMQTLYDFENTVRNDGRWLKTQNAQDSVMSTTRKVLTDFGLIGD